MLDSSGCAWWEEGCKEEVVSGGDDDDIVIFGVKLFEERYSTPSSSWDELAGLYKADELAIEILCQSMQG